MRLLAAICLLVIGHVAAFGQLVANDDLELRAGPNSSTTLNVGANDIFPSQTTIEIVRQPTSGALVQHHSEGWVNYTPKSGFTGMDSFTYRLKSGSAVSRVALAKVRVRFAVAGVDLFYENFPDHDVYLEVNFLGCSLSDPELLEMWSDVPSLKPPRHVWIQPGCGSWYRTYRVQAPNKVQRGRLYYRFNGETGSIPVVHEPFNLNFRIFPSRGGATGFIDPNAGLHNSAPYTLKASTPLVSIPSQIDGRSQSFNINVLEARWSFPVTIEIRRGNQFWTASFQTVPAFLIADMEADRIKGGQTTNLRVSFAGNVGWPGRLELRSNSQWAQVPATVTLPSGNQTQVNVPVQTMSTRIERTITIWARIRGVERKVTLTVTP